MTDFKSEILRKRCPCCDGKSSEYPDPAYYCGYCKCELEVSLWKYIYWKFCEKFLWRR